MKRVLSVRALLEVVHKVLSIGLLLLRATSAMQRDGITSRTSGTSSLRISFSATSSSSSGAELRSSSENTGASAAGAAIRLACGVAHGTPARRLAGHPARRAARAQGFE